MLSLAPSLNETILNSHKPPGPEASLLRIRIRQVQNAIPHRLVRVVFSDHIKYLNEFHS